MRSVCSTIRRLTRSTCPTLLPRQRLRSDLDGPNIASLGIPPPLPRLDIPMVHKVPMQAQLQLQRQMQHGQRALRQVLRIKNHHVIPQHIQVIHQRDQIPLALAAAVPRNKRRLLERARRPSPIHVLRPRRARRVQVPRVVAQAIEQPAGRGAALGKVVGPGRVDLGQPEVLVRLGHPAVVDAAELAVGGPDERGRDARVGFGGWVEDPARRGAGEAVGAGAPVGGSWVGRPPEEDVAVGDGEVDDYVAVLVLVAAGDVAMEG